ncbi:hypothetical protein RNI52_26960 [Labrys neptuniae]|uniref:hypothetical protein n=1 Tax=Labrys neptuniae TaxID=376174 RepID=UPI00288FD6BC|nr:hypothetical protein [Labrys neptuniae]MDT3380996.1 hypothetical protein [Labrys neptuniae]
MLTWPRDASLYHGDICFPFSQSIAMTTEQANLLRACYLSGQMSEAQWQEHIRNGDVTEEVPSPATGAKSLPDMLAELEAIYDLRPPAKTLVRPEI